MVAYKSSAAVALAAATVAVAQNGTFGASGVSGGSNVNIDINFTINLPSLCPTGVIDVPYVISQHCPYGGCPTEAPSDLGPYGFVSTTTICTLCGPQPTIVTVYSCPDTATAPPEACESCNTNAIVYTPYAETPCPPTTIYQVYTPTPCPPTPPEYPVVPATVTECPGCPIAYVTPCPSDTPYVPYVPAVSIPPVPYVPTAPVYPAGGPPTTPCPPDVPTAPVYPAGGPPTTPCPPDVPTAPVYPGGGEVPTTLCTTPIYPYSNQTAIPTPEVYTGGAGQKAVGIAGLLVAGAIAALL